VRQLEPCACAGARAHWRPTRPDRKRRRPQVRLGHRASNANSQGTTTVSFQKNRSKNVIRCVSLGNESESFANKIARPKRWIFESDGRHLGADPMPIGSFVASDQDTFRYPTRLRCWTTPRPTPRSSMTTKAGRSFSISALIVARTSGSSSRTEMTCVR
jgi:hypothetical protein